MNEQSRLCYFLGRLFQEELDPETLQKVKAVSFPERGPWAKAGRRWNACAAALSEGDLEVLAADYARTFLGAGLAEAAAAFPYASVYTSPRGILMQDAWSRMRQALRERGLEPAGLLEDHISVELAYLAALDGPAERAGFARTELQNWVPRFCGDVERYAETELYRAAAGLLRTFVDLSAGGGIFPSERLGVCGAGGF